MVVDGDVLLEMGMVVEKEKRSGRWSNSEGESERIESWEIYESFFSGSPSALICMDIYRFIWRVLDGKIG